MDRVVHDDPQRGRRDGRRRHADLPDQHRPGAEGHQDRHRVGYQAQRADGQTTQGEDHDHRDQQHGDGVPRQHAVDVAL